MTDVQTGLPGSVGGQTPTDTNGGAHGPSRVQARLRGPVRQSWGEGTLTRATELEALWLSMLRQNPRASELMDLDAATWCHLEAARDAAEHLNKGRWRWRDGPLLERAMSNLDAAESNLLQAASADYLLGQLPCLVNQTQRHLPQDDPRRQALQAIARDIDGDVAEPTSTAGAAQARPKTVEEKKAILLAERNRIVSIARAASSAGMREQLRVRSFRNIVVAVALVMLALAVLLAILAFRAPAVFALCFQPEQGGQTVVVCPTGQSQAVPADARTGPTQPAVDALVPTTVRPWDVTVVELLGAVAAAVVGSASLRRLRGSSEPHGLPVALGALKLPTGALTAVLGLLLMRGGFVPGLSALDTSGQILAWAILFGGSQQLFTRLVDQQAHTVLDAVRGSRDVVSTPRPS
jgi:hypothetical protein